MMIPRNQILQALNNSGMPSMMDEVKAALMLRAKQALVKEPEQLTDKDIDRRILLNFGPAAAADAVDYAIKRCRSQGKYNGLAFNHSMTNNLQLVMNDEVEGYQPFSNVLRQFLLPRYAYLDFDRIVDPRHMIDAECGYPKFITPIMYRYMYDRDDVARRVVDFYPDESWAVSPAVYDGKDQNEETPFTEDWRVLCDDYNLLQYLYRMDRLAGIGHYGALLLGIDDGLDLETPIDAPRLLAGIRNSVSDKERGLLYMRPFDEYLSFIHMYETDVMHPRYGLPKFYNLVFLDMTIDAAGASIGTRLNRRVHWTRVVHVADNLQSSLVFGIPRMQPVFNRLLDLRKIKGGSAEMFWKGAFPGFSFEIDPRFAADEVEFDKENFRKEIEEYSEGLRRYLTTLGVSAKSLAPQVADPEKHIHAQLMAIAMYMNAPIRIFMGSEESRQAGTQDTLSWNKRLGRRLNQFVDPYLLRAILDRFIAIGVMRPPKNGRYKTGWGDLNTPTDEDKANLALKWTQAGSQYVASGLIHLIPPMDYFTTIMGFKPADALRIMTEAQKAGGFDKLFKVDPSQGTGVNGVRQNQVSKGDREGTSSSRPAKRDTADKKAEGSSS